MERKAGTVGWSGRWAEEMKKKGFGMINCRSRLSRVNPVREEIERRLRCRPEKDADRPKAPWSGREPMMLQP